MEVGIIESKHASHEALCLSRCYSYDTGTEEITYAVSKEKPRGGENKTVLRLFSHMRLDLALDFYLNEIREIIEKEEQDSGNQNSGKQGSKGISQVEV